MLVPVRELSGTALDVATAKAVGQFLEQWRGTFYVPGHCGASWATAEYFASRPVWSPSSNWDQCGPLISQFGIELRPLMGKRWAACAWENGQRVQGDSAEEAICLAVVAAKLGLEVEVPSSAMGN